MNLKNNMTTKEIAELILSNPNGYTDHSVQVAKAYIKLLKQLGLYEDDKLFKSDPGEIE